MHITCNVIAFHCTEIHNIIRVKTILVLDYWVLGDIFTDIG